MIFVFEFRQMSKSIITTQKKRIFILKMSSLNSNSLFKTELFCVKNVGFLKSVEFLSFRQKPKSIIATQNKKKNHFELNSY